MPRPRIDVYCISLFFDMTLLSSILRVGRPTRPYQPFVLLQSSAAQSCLPILRNLIETGTSGSHESLKTSRHTLLFCLLYPSANLSRDTPLQSIQIYDLLSNIVGYTNDWIDPRDTIMSAVLSGEDRLG